ncbi:winged helix-turn-helix transcriptional regulator [Brevundimonas balnearis]|uniref:Winged helix-turn-helix transcriptional regulator n=1 Tax=Brevundimonas balnearis TaxID=1572858 RepID=A0ABV6R0P3_9CAUL
MELVGERWSLMIVRELMFGPRRFSDIRSALPGISANVLTQRLETLEAHGVVERTRLPPPASVQVYGLTPWGYEADEMIMALGRWAARSPDHDPSLPLSNTSLMMSFRTMFDPGKAAGDGGRFGFRLGEETFVVTVADGRLTAARAPAESVDVVFVGAPEPIAGFVYENVPLEALGDALELEGDAARALAFQSWFKLPPKATKPQPPE